jgi:predicted 2-oxoglutarate/Fe(II)-dependent dioxygenase YbiX
MEKPRMMSSITTELTEILKTIDRPGNFYTAGTTEIFAPHIEVEGVGPIALPLLPIQVEQLVAVAEQAPYGRGEETLVDTEVRRTWQINANQIRIEGRHWPQALESIVARVAEGLGVIDKVEAELYKLLVYEEGCFFVDHRDTEKAARMFATLVIVLPSLYTGGELLVRHQDREARLDLSCSDLSEVSFAAFYADCVHEVLPITSGCRLTLVYNLLRSGKGQLPEPPNYDAETSGVVKRLQQWISGKQLPNDDSPEKLIYPLEHAYTPAALAFDALKGADAAVATVLVKAAQDAECDLHLALVSIQESGEAENNRYYGSRSRSRWHDDDDDDDDDDDGDFEIGEVYERSTTLSEWRRPDGKPTAMGSSVFEEKELCPPDAFDELEPDKLHFQEATGNEGASFDRTYQRAAMVLWPTSRRLAVLNQTGLSVTLPYLDELTQCWIKSGEDSESSLWQEAHELTGHMLRTWPQKSWRSVALGETVQMLTLLTQLRDIASIDAFLSALSAAGIYEKGDNKALIRAISLLSSQRRAALIEHIISGNVLQALNACGDLLVRALEADWASDRTADFIPAATALVEALPGDSNRTKLNIVPWHRLSQLDSDFVVNLLTALGHLDTPLADQAVHHILEWPKTYDLDSVLVLAVLTLNTRVGMRENTAFQDLRAACLNHLHTRIAEPLEPPQDWTRDGKLICKCTHCNELSLFLSAPDRESWAFRAVESARSHVENSIRRSGCDLAFITEKRGRPYGLICTKNRASYEKRAQQRKQDLEYVAQIEMLPAKTRRLKK